MNVAYYNENDPFAAQWLRNLIRAGHIAPGEVDERSISNVRPDDLSAFTQCHFFAGIGGWSVALRLAGWPDDRPVWTGSCPCQPFSAAGAGKAADDERHLWPAWFSLIAERHPATVFGEQVEAAIGFGWLDAVFADLEEQGYACGATILPASSVGAPHIRQRCWFVADAGSERAWRDSRDGASTEAQSNSERIAPRVDASNASIARRATGDMADTAWRGRREQPPESATAGNGPSRYADDGCGIGELADTERRDQWRHGGDARSTAEAGSGEARPANGDAAGGASSMGGMADSEPATRPCDPRCGRLDPWRGCDWLPCTDGKARPVRPGSFPLAHGVQRRTSKLRAYGNAIVPQVAAEFIAAYGEIAA